MKKLYRVDHESNDEFWTRSTKAMKKPRTPQAKHANHPTELRPGVGPHAARLWCVQCRKHIQWVSKIQSDQIQQLFPEMKK